MNITPYLKLMAERNASDLYFTTGAPASVRIEGETKPVSRTVLEPGLTKRIAYSIMDERQIKEFEVTKEMNLGLSVAQVGRFRVNVYMQRGEVSMVIRFIKCQIPSMEQLNLPPVLKDLVLHKNGLMLTVGSTGSGKSTTLAAMIDYRSEQRSGHILTIEDPIEYVFSHRKSIIGQREVGLDTLNYENALREAMREAPDMIMIGEVRDRHTMEAAIAYADTGHLCLTTLHAVNANQALDRVINFFPPEAKRQILMDLSLNLRGIVSQRLVLGTDGKRVPAVEVLVNTPYISELITKGQLADIKGVMEKGAVNGMQTFDQSLYELYKVKKISLQEALANADSRGNLEWRINFGDGENTLDKTSDHLEFPSDIIMAETKADMAEIGDEISKDSGETLDDLNSGTGVNAEDEPGRESHQNSGTKRGKHDASTSAINPDSESDFSELAEDIANLRAVFGDDSDDDHSKVF
jgi:twitching motility protein PilU